MNAKGFNKDLRTIWLKLRIDKDRELHFRVRGVGEPGYREDDEWMLIDFVVLEKDNYGYAVFGDESLTADELEALEFMLDKAIAGKLKSSWWLYTIEQEFMISVEMVKSKRFNLMEMATVYNKTKTFDIDETRDYSVEPCLVIRDEIPYSCDDMCVKLYGGNLSRVSLYLKLVKGEISLEDRRIRSMFRNGILYRDDGRFREKKKQLQQQQEQEWRDRYNE